MPCWFFDKADLIETPSFKDGIDTETETRYRREGVGFLFSVGNTLSLRCDTMATGAVFFHRFYLFQSFKEFPRYKMAACCLFLAGKVEETPKKCKDIVRGAKSYFENLKDLNYKKYADMFTDDNIKEIMTLEKILLQTIKFDLQIDHPYGYLVKYAKTFNANPSKLQDLVQRTWAFINDSFCTTLCLQWEPEIIAIGLIHLTITKNKVDISNWIDKDTIKQNWWDQFVLDLDKSIIEDICHQALDLYERQREQKNRQVQAPKAPVVQNGTQPPTANKRVNFSTCGPTYPFFKSPPDTLSLTPTLNSVGYNEQMSPTSAKLMKTLNEPIQQYQGYQISMNQSYYHESFNPHYATYAQAPPPPPPPHTGQPMMPQFYGYFPHGNPPIMHAQYPPPQPPPSHFPPTNKPYHQYNMPPNQHTDSYHQFNGHKEQSHVNINGNKIYNTTSNTTNSSNSQIRSSALKTVSITDRPV